MLTQVFKKLGIQLSLKPKPKQQAVLFDHQYCWNSEEEFSTQLDIMLSELRYDLRGVVSWKVWGLVWLGLPTVESGKLRLRFLVFESGRRV